MKNFLKHQSVTARNEERNEKIDREKNQIV